MCAVRGTKLYGLRIKKTLKVKKMTRKISSKELILSLKKVGSRGKAIKRD